MTCRIAGIYELFNTKSLKSYVGSSHDILKRCARHEKMLESGVHYNKHLQASWDFYGGNAFEFYVLEECVREQLINREQHYIDTLQPKYNMCQIAGIGSSNKGKKFSDEHRHKISEALKGYRLSEEHKRSISLANTGHANFSGHTHSEETKKKISETKKGHSFGFIGHHTEETKRKISESLKSHTGWHHSEETRKKMSDAKIGNQNAKKGYDYDL